MLKAISVNTQHGVRTEKLRDTQHNTCSTLWTSMFRLCAYTRAIIRIRYFNYIYETFFYCKECPGASCPLPPLATMDGNDLLCHHMSMKLQFKLFLMTKKETQKKCSFPHCRGRERETCGSILEPQRKEKDLHASIQGSY